MHKPYAALLIAPSAQERPLSPVLSICVRLVLCFRPSSKTFLFIYYRVQTFTCDASQQYTSFWVVVKGYGDEYTLLLGPQELYDIQPL